MSRAKKRTLDEITAELHALQEFEPERAHARADELLLEALRNTAGAKAEPVIAAFEALTRWYA